MRKLGIFSSVLLISLTACSTQDPILPGQRESIFNGYAISVVGKEISDLPENVSDLKTQDCKYTQDSSNIIWDGDKKIFNGFPTNNFVKNNQKPICDGKFIYAGLTTGELVKVDPKTKNIEWISDIYRESNMLGGASMLDIIAPVVVKKDGVYVGGLGDAFCKINKNNGNKIWCLDIGVSVPFTIVNDYVFVVGTNNMLYAVKTSNGEVYWASNIEEQSEPIYKNKMIIVKHQKFDALTGKEIK